jgi:outer membrane protein OmpA-like peptidoglycan-associated protein
MNSGTKPTIFALSSIVVFTAISIAQTQSITDGSQAKIKGTISSRSGPHMTIQQPDGSSVVAVLNDKTQVKMKEGKLDLRKKQVDVTMLLPGLRVEVQGTGSAQGQLVANKVEFTEKDLQTARSIQAGTASLSNQEQQLSTRERTLKQQEQQLTEKENATQQAAQEANQQADAAKAAAAKAQQSANRANTRVSELDQYVAKDSATVYFDEDKTSVSPDAMEALNKLASTALATDAYMIQVAGYASKTGSVQINEELSNECANAVIAYLTRSCNIPLFRVLAPAAMGASDQAGGNEALNRRVVVKVIVNKGIAQ